MDKYTVTDQYLTTLFSLKDNILDRVIDSIAEHQLDPHSISPLQAQLLTQYAHLAQAKTIVEVGTLAGYSSIVMARALPNEGHLYTIDPDPLCCQVAQQNIELAGLSDKVTVLQGTALEVLNNRLRELDKVDLFFMDGDKPNYVAYHQWAIARMGTGKLIIADNVLREGAVLDKESTDAKVLGARRYLEFLAQDHRSHHSILPLAGEKGFDGMAISVVK
ncbi:MAG: O-methyltransferase [Bacteroidota bacterium]